MDVGEVRVWLKSRREAEEMIFNCDLTGMFEDGGIGAVIGAVVVFLVNLFWGRRTNTAGKSQSQYLK